MQGRGCSRLHFLSSLVCCDYPFLCLIVKLLLALKERSAIASIFNNSLQPTQARESIKAAQEAEKARLKADIERFGSAVEQVCLAEWLVRGLCPVNSLMLCTTSSPLLPTAPHLDAPRRTCSM